MIDGMLVVDVHNHIGEGDTGGMWGNLKNTPDDLVERMDKNGIDKSVALPFVSGLMAREDFIAANNYVAAAVKKYPNRLIGFGTVTPMHGKFAIEEIRRFTEAGLKGIKLYPPGHGCYRVDADIMNPIMEEAIALNIPVLSHSDFTSKICSPYQVVRLAKRFPKATIIMAHFGMDADLIYFIPEIIEETKNVYVDTSCTPDIPENIYAVPAKTIADRMLYGTDLPTLSPECNLKKLQVAEELFGLTKEQKKKILGVNAAKILGLQV